MINYNFLDNFIIYLKVTLVDESQDKEFSEFSDQSYDVAYTSHSAKIRQNLKNKFVKKYFRIIR